MTEAEQAVAMDEIGCALVGGRANPDGSVLVRSLVMEDRVFTELEPLRAYLAALVGGELPAEIGEGRVRNSLEAMDWLRRCPAVVWHENWELRMWVPFRYRLGAELNPPCGVVVKFF